MDIPCTNSNAGSLSSLDSGDRLKAIHVILILVTLSTIEAVNWNVDIRMPCVWFTTICGGITTVSPLFTSSISFAFHINISAEPVQLNSATPLSEIFTDCGGVMISAGQNICSRCWLH